MISSYWRQIRPIMFALIAAVVLGSCERASVVRAPEHRCTDDNLANLFFPQDAFVPKLIDVDDELRDTLARYLQAANEAPWICGEVPSEGYRLFIGGGYGLPAIVASAARTSSGWRLAVSEFQRLRPGTAYVVTKRSGNEIQEVPSHMDLIRFGGQFPKGGYDVHNGRDTKPAAPPALH
jgi:hypothetical protein